MLPRERSSVADHQIGSLLDKPPIILHPFSGKQIERNGRVDTSLAEMAVERRFVMEFLQQRTEIAEIIPEFLRRDGGILPALPGRRFTRDKCARSLTRLAHIPHHLLVSGLVIAPHRGRAVLPLEPAHQL